MYPIMLFLHVLSAVLVGFYLLLPFMIKVAATLSKPAQEGFARSLLFLNRIGQYILIAAFVTGGYMVSKVNVSILWMIAAVLLLIVMAAMAGMMGKPIKRWMENAKTGKSSESELGKLGTFSAIAGLSLLAIIVIMVFPALL